MIRQDGHFEKPDREDTLRRLEIGSGPLDEGFSHLISAKTTGETGQLFARKLQGRAVNIVAVTDNVGYGSNCR